MKQYPKYKDSGIEWLGKIPSEWITAPIRALCYLGRGRVISNEEIVNNIGDYPVYSSQTSENGIMGKINTYDFDGEYVTWTTDGANAGTVFHRQGKFNCTNVCGTLKSKADKIYLKYLPYVLNLGTKCYVRYDINPKLMNNEMAAIPVPLPSINEQKSIAEFLDRKTTQIDELIAKKERMIELLNEERTAVINHAVTKGLDPNAEMKDSGVEWLGKIPKHWGIKKLKHTTYIKGRVGWQALTTSEYISEGPYLVTGTDFDKDTINWNGCFHVSEDRYKMDPYIVLQNGDLLITKDGTIGKVAVVRNMPDKATLNSGVFLTRPLDKDIYLPDFMFWLLNSDVFMHFIDYTKKGSTISHLYQEIFREFIYAVPKISEQKEIVIFLKNATNGIDSTINKQEQQIDNLTEYRTALISEVVTGKIDLRN